MRALRLALAPLGLMFGLAVEWVFYDSTLGLALTVVDFAVGCLLIVAGALAWDRRAESRVGPLMTLAGLTWFLGNLGGPFVYLHRGPLVHLVLSYPTGIVRGRAARLVVAAAYLDALFQPLARNDFLTLVLAVAVAFAACRGFFASSGPARRAGSPALFAALAIAAALALAAACRLIGVGHRDAVLLAYDVTIASITVVLLVDLLHSRWAERTVGDLVVDLGATSDVAGLRSKLARALGDPSLVLGYRLDEAGGLVDDAGRRLELPALGSGRTVTRLDEQGAEIGVLVHDDAVLADPVLIDSVAAAAQLALANARLQAEARERAAELEESRRRIVESTDRQRRRLERELAEGPERLLEQAAACLATAMKEAREADSTSIASLEAGIADAQRVVRAFAQGIRPRALSEGGLMRALAVHVAHSPIPVELRGHVSRLPEPIEATLYFVCSEGIANVVKHSRASRVVVEAWGTQSAVFVVVSDNGIGGAHLSTGSGLQGLIDRVEALGGQLEIESRPGHGTSLRAQVPLHA